MRWACAGPCFYSLCISRVGNRFQPERRRCNHGLQTISEGHLTPILSPSTCAKNVTTLLKTKSRGCFRNRFHRFHRRTELLCDVRRHRQDYASASRTERCRRRRISARACCSSRYLIPIPLFCSSRILSPLVHMRTDFQFVFLFFHTVSRKAGRNFRFENKWQTGSCEYF